MEPQVELQAEAEPNQRLGRYVSSSFGGETVRAFVPPPLPPLPAVQTGGFQVLLELANQAIGRLDGVSSLLPDPAFFLYSFVRKEAVLSSQIEGTQSSLSDLLALESDEAAEIQFGDVLEVSSYVAAQEYGVMRLRDGFPLSLRLIREIHEILLSTGRGSDKEPGEFRRSQNWIGGTRPGNAAFVPAPPDLIMDCMGQLELFLHDESHGIPLLIKAGLAHVQFETIHPFLDGNGRLGRLLITFMLCAGGALREPSLYLSLYLKSHRATYYELLNRVRTHGDWETWMEFFLTAVKETAGQAALTARKILDMHTRDRARVEKLGRPAASALRVFQGAQINPVFTIASASRKTGLSFPSVSSAVGHLMKLGLVAELTGRQRGRLFAYKEYLDLLSEGTEPLARGTA